MAKNGGGGGVAWLALIVSLVALFFSWKAYERSGGRLDLLDREVSVGTEAPDWREALAHARERLAEQRDELDSGNLDKVREDVARIRQSLERAGAGARREWRDLDADLERLEGQLREGSSRARETLDSALEKIRREERRP
jgi:hypothetical protein